MKDNTIVIRQNTRDVTVDFLANFKKIIRLSQNYG